MENKHLHNKNKNNQTPGSGNQYHETHTSHAPGYGENSQLARQTEQQYSNDNQGAVQ